MESERYTPTVSEQPVTGEVATAVLAAWMQAARHRSGLNAARLHTDAARALSDRRCLKRLRLASTGACKPLSRARTACPSSRVRRARGGRHARSYAAASRPAQRHRPRPAAVEGRPHAGAD